MRFLADNSVENVAQIVSEDRVRWQDSEARNLFDKSLSLLGVFSPPPPPPSPSYDDTIQFFARGSSSVLVVLALVALTVFIPAY